MSQCEKCNAYDDWAAENIFDEWVEEGKISEDISDEKFEELMENDEDYEPNLDYYWHGDIQEDYDMGEYTCLCESCFGTLLNQGKIKTTKDRDWNCEIHGWGNPDGWDNEPSKLSQ